MAYSISTLLSDITTVVHGTTINKIPNPYGLINRAARSILLDVDPKETQRITSIGQVFNEVYDYNCPVDLKGDRLVDLRPQAPRYPSDVYFQTYAQTFDAQKTQQLNKRVYTQWNTGVKSLRIEAPTLTAPVVITDTSTVEGWSATLGADNISLNTTNNVAGGGAIVFDLLAGHSSGYIENSTITALDLTAHLNISTLFLWVYMPSGVSISSVDLRWGSSLTDYWTTSTSQTQEGTSFVDGWNLLAFPWQNAPFIGSPNAQFISYVRVTPSYNSKLQTGVQINNLTSNLGFFFDLQYYSKFLFRDPNTNVFQETVNDSADNDKIINLDTESYNLLFNKMAFFVAQSLQGADAQYDADYWQTEYKNALAMYKAANPSESSKKAESYYALPNKNYNRFQAWRLQGGC